jgi:hypothetical protein
VTSTWGSTCDGRTESIGGYGVNLKHLVAIMGDFGYERGLTIPDAEQGLCELDGV